MFSIIIQAPDDKVWATLRNFHDLSWARDVVPHVEKVGEKALFMIDYHSAGYFKSC